MKLTYMTLFPELITNYLGDALLKKAETKNILKFETLQMRNFSDNKYKSVDDTAYGGGDGMILRPDIAQAGFNQLYQQVDYNSAKTCRIYLSPQGKKIDHHLAKNLAQYDHLVFLCGRYGGIDQRIINQHIDLEISIGDYVLSGGELAALVVTEAVSRFVPGVLGDIQSAESDSLANGLLEAPQFTKPAVYLDQAVPQVLMSGHHEKITLWKKHISFLMTWKKRKDLFLEKWMKLTESQKKDHSKYVSKHISELTSELAVIGLTLEDLQNYLSETQMQQTTKNGDSL